MRSILENHEQRKLNLIEVLYFSNDWIPISSLSKTIGCPVRTIKQDIVYLKQLVTADYLQSSQKGVRLVLPSYMSIEIIYQTILKESTHFNLLECLFHDDIKNFNQMAEFLYTSPTTLLRIIKKINLSLEKFSLRIQTNPLTLVGPEYNIRALYIYYFMERYTYSEWPYPTLDQQPFEDFLIESAQRIQFQLDFSHFEWIKHWIAVSFIRAQKGYFIEKGENKLAKYIPNLIQLQPLIKPFEKKMNLSFQPEFIAKVSEAFADNTYAYSYEDLLEASRNNLVTRRLVNLLSSFLESLSKKLGIDLPNKELLLLKMYNLSKLVSRQTGSTQKITHSLFDKKSYFLRSLEEDVPEFIEIVTQQLGHYQKESSLTFTTAYKNELIYTFAVYWENLLIELHQKRLKAKILLISTYDLEHAKLLGNVIHLHYPDEVDINIYSEHRLSVNQLEKIDYDILISTTSFYPIPNKKIICIQSFPTDYNLREIKTAIDDIRQSRAERLVLD